jgi:hypothetical protein
MLAGNSFPHDEHVQKEFVDRYELLFLASYWQKDWAQSIPDPVCDRQWQDGLQLSDFVGDGPDQVSFGWSDALRVRSVHCYGAGLRDRPLPVVPPGEGEEKGCLVERWRLYGFALWDRKRVETLKRLGRFEAFQTGFILDAS